MRKTHMNLALKRNNEDQFGTRMVSKKMKRSCLGRNPGAKGSNSLSCGKSPENWGSRGKTRRVVEEAGVFYVPVASHRNGGERGRF